MELAQAIFIAFRKALRAQFCFKVRIRRIGYRQTHIFSRYISRLFCTSGTGKTDLIPGLPIRPPLFSQNLNGCSRSQTAYGLITGSGPAANV